VSFVDSIMGLTPKSHRDKRLGATTGASRYERKNLQGSASTLRTLTRKEGVCFYYESMKQGYNV
jgi:hypothetical protein